MSGQISGVVVVRLEQHLTRAALAAALDAVDVAPGSGLIVDCLTMTGYDAAARSLFVEWHRERRGKLRAVAVVTDKSMWHMIVSAMSLASGQKMRAFDTHEAAAAWLESP